MRTPGGRAVSRLIQSVYSGGRQTKAKKTLLSGRDATGLFRLKPSPFAGLCRLSIPCETHLKPSQAYQCLSEVEFEGEDDAIRS